jgi:hypothetical protein
LQELTERTKGMLGIAIVMVMGYCPQDSPCIPQSHTPVP